MKELLDKQKLLCAEAVKAEYQKSGMTNLAKRAYDACLNADVAEPKKQPAAQHTKEHMWEAWQESMNQIYYVAYQHRWSVVEERFNEWYNQKFNKEKP